MHQCQHTKIVQQKSFLRLLNWGLSKKNLAFGNHGEFEDETVDSSLEAVEFPNPEDLLSHLGEVVLSYPQAQRQALENTVSIDSEIALLVIHGILHLLGYEHHTNDQEILMTDSQSKILRSFLENAKSANHGK